MKVILICFLLLLMKNCSNNQDVINTKKEYCLNNSIEAIKQAEKKWLEIYGSNIYDKKPFTVELKNDTMWVIQGTLSKWKEGGVPYAEINAKNCEFIKITHGK